MRHWLLFTLLAATAAAKTVELKIYPPEVRFHAGSEGQKVLVVATDDEGVSRKSPPEVMFRRPVLRWKPIARSKAPSREPELCVPASTVSAEVPVEVLPGAAASAELHQRHRSRSLRAPIAPTRTATDPFADRRVSSCRSSAAIPTSTMTPSRKTPDGKRIDKANPANSLVLRKPTFQVPHGGGQRFKVGSRTTI